jgi:hypothetical protein
MTGEVFPMLGTAVEYYRAQLATRLGDSFDPSLWEPMAEVGCLFLRAAGMPCLLRPMPRRIFGRLCVAP